MAATQMNEISTAENRFNMVECQLKPGGIRDYRLTKHMNSIPREAFISGTAAIWLMPICNCNALPVSQPHHADPNRFGIVD